MLLLLLTARRIPRLLLLWNCYTASTVSCQLIYLYVLIRNLNPHRGGPQRKTATGQSRNVCYVCEMKRADTDVNR